MNDERMAAQRQQAMERLIGAAYQAGRTDVADVAGYKDVLKARSELAAAQAALLDLISEPEPRAISGAEIDAVAKIIYAWTLRPWHPADDARDDARAVLEAAADAVRTGVDK